MSALHLHLDLRNENARRLYAAYEPLPEYDAMCTPPKPPVRAGLSEIDQASAQFITRDMAKPLGLPVPVGGCMVQPLSDELIRRGRVRQFLEKVVCFTHV